jgi:hypothetical protein
MSNFDVINGHSITISLTMSSECQRVSVLLGSQLEGKSMHTIISRSDLPQRIGIPLDTHPGGIQGVARSSSILKCQGVDGNRLLVGEGECLEGDKECEQHKIFTHGDYYKLSKNKPDK